MRVARSNLVRVRTSLRQSAAEMAEACAIKALEEAADGLDRQVTVLDYGNEARDGGEHRSGPTERHSPINSRELEK